jgi:hypothetical protein
MENSIICDIGYLKYINTDYSIVTDKRGNRSGAKKINYLDIVTAFDIETSTIFINGEPQSFMYIWQFQWGKYTTIIGRTWNEFKRLVKWIDSILPENVRLVTYIHNLAYEFQFLQGIFHFDSEDVFVPQSHKVLKATLGNKIEFRCSYKHSNMSLDKWLKNVGVESNKLSGDLDYSIIRYPWTRLTYKELMYCVNDVRGVVQAIYKEMEMDGDDLITIPMTSTGYLRRDVKKAMRSYPVSWLKKTIPPYEVYLLLRKAFEGGDTHANRHFSGKILENVESDDRSSSYPAVMENELFPMGRWNISNNLNNSIINDLKKSDNAWVAEVEIDNIRLIGEFFPDPIISKHKTEDLRGYVEDNGRVLSAKHLKITITDVKYFCMCRVYKWDNFKINKLYYCKYGKLPKPILDIINENYRLKTELKGVDGQEYYYFKRKEKINAGYGMTAQDPVQQVFLYCDGEFKKKDDDHETIYNRFIKSAFLSYAWGVWVTAWSRKHLLDGIIIAYQQGKYVYYWDTDSVKHSVGVDYANYNKDRIKECMISESHATDKKGNEHYMGTYENEGIYRRFKTLGAKKYVYEDQEGNLHITIAGVNKILGAKELKKYGGIEAFREGFVFKESERLETVYNTNVNFDYDTGEGSAIHISDNLSLVQSTYTLGVSGDYSKLLKWLSGNEKFINLLKNRLDK